MKKRIVSLGSGAFIVCLLLAPLGAREIPAEDSSVLKGTTKEFSLAESRIFPGTRRGGAVFIPAQNDAA